MLLLFCVTVLSVLYACLGAYDEALAVQLVALSSAAYCDAHVEKLQWGCAACQLNGRVAPLAAFRYHQDDGFAYIAAAHDQKRLVLVFRGTDPISLDNWLADLRFNRRRSPSVRGEVHDGFQDIASGLWTAGVLERALELWEQTPDYQFLVTGHSLGGALATLSAVQLALDVLQRDSALVRLDLEKMDVYVFGAPLVGDNVFARVAESLFADNGVEHYRVVHYRDPVAVIPNHWLGFRHIGKEIFYQSGMDRGEFAECKNSYSGCGTDSLSIHASVDDHVFYFDIAFGIYCYPYSNTIRDPPPRKSIPQSSCAGDSEPAVDGLSNCRAGAFGTPGACIAADLCQNQNGTVHERIDANVPLCPTGFVCCVHCGKDESPLNRVGIGGAKPPGATSTDRSTTTSQTIFFNTETTTSSANLLVHNVPLASVPLVLALNAF